MLSYGYLRSILDFLSVLGRKNLPIKACTTGFKYPLTICLVTTLPERDDFTKPTTRHLAAIIMEQRYSFWGFVNFAPYWRDYPGHRLNQGFDKKVCVIKGAGNDAIISYHGGTRGLVMSQVGWPFGRFESCLNEFRMEGVQKNVLEKTWQAVNTIHSSVMVGWHW